MTNGQVSFATIFPNSATVYMVLDANTARLALNDYLVNLNYDAAAVVGRDTLNGYPLASVAIAATGHKDFYVELPNKTILIIYTQVGGGPLKPELDAEIKYMLGTIRYNETNPSANGAVADFLSEVRKNLLIQGKGKTILGQLKDGVVILTDTIGIGTGPIDYYFSAIYNVTLKYERGSDTLLAMKDGKTTAF